MSLVIVLEEISLGLSEKGHLISLKAFCVSKQFDSKVELVNYIKDAGQERVKGKEKRKGQKNTRKINFGLMKFNEKSGKYISVRLSKGGGVRQVEVNCDICNDLIEMGRAVFSRIENTWEMVQFRKLQWGDN